MSVAYFRFYGELNDFLPASRQKVEFPHEFRGRPSVKHLIEAIGVPHPEVALILVNGCSVDFTHHLFHGDRVSVYPVFEGVDSSSVIQLHPDALGGPAFVLDVHLGKLARMLRLLGFDTLYRNDYEDARIVAISASDARIVLTRDRELLKASAVRRGYWVRSGDVNVQILEVLRRFNLFSGINAFRRCLKCNGILGEKSKAEVLSKLQPKTILYYDLFFECLSCGQVYWEGTHVVRLKEKIARLTSDAKISNKSR